MDFNKENIKKEFIKNSKDALAEMVESSKKCSQYMMRHFLDYSGMSKNEVLEITGWPKKKLDAILAGEADLRMSDMHMLAIINGAEINFVPILEENEDEAGEEDVVEDDEENLDELGDEIPHWETLDEEEKASEKSSDENEIPTEELKKLKEMMEKLFPGSKISVGEIKVN